MKRVIARHVEEPRAMYRENLGWISFRWGNPGTPPPTFKTDIETLAWWRSLPNKLGLFQHGHGVSHIIAKRNWEGKWIKEFLGQKGEDLALLLVSVIARGRPEKHGVKASITMPGYTVGLELRKQEGRKANDDIEYWLITGFAHKKKGYELIFESSDDIASLDFRAADELVGVEPSCSTCVEPTRRPTSTQVPHHGGEQTTPVILSESTHAMPTVYCHGVGAAGIGFESVDGNGGVADPLCRPTQDIPESMTWGATASS